MKIRTMQPTDIKAAAAIVGKNYSHAYQIAATKEMRAMFKPYPVKPKYIVAEERGRIVGLAGYNQSWLDYAVYNIFWVNVLPAFQGKGIGSALIQKTIDIIKKKKPKAILITTAKPGLYAKKFKFKTLAKFKSDHYDLMFLRLKN